ncbi:MAG: hypothetical protein IOB84_12590 [Brevundimonas sp.]|nr:hypothetical protein [Brevundimonas sp.]
MDDTFHCVECGGGQHCTGGNGCLAEATRQVFGFRTLAPLPLYPTEAHIARALALLDRVGDAAADALIKGEAAVVPDAKHMTDEVAEAIAEEARVCGGIAYDVWRKALAAGRLDRENDNA